MILASLKPYYYYLIGERKKTIEVRKSALKDLPQDIVFYMSKDERSFAKIPKEFQAKYRKHFGKIGIRAVVDNVFLIKNQGIGFSVAGEEQSVMNEIARQSCLYYDDMVNYLGNKDGYGWHISDLKIYDKPKELSEFKTPPCEKSEKACGNCKWLVKINTPDVYECECYVEDGRPITRPPQSYMRVEELGE